MAIGGEIEVVNIRPLTAVNDLLEKELNQKIILHCGAHKTGSTSFQHLLSTHQEKLFKAGIFFVPVRRKYRPVDDVRFLLSELDRPVNQSESNLDHIRKVIDRIFQESQASTLIITNEDLLRYPFEPNCQEFYPKADQMATLISKALRGKDVEVRFFIRNFASLIPSWYVQQVRMGETLSFLKYTAQIDFRLVSWLPIVDALRRNFGASNVRVFDHSDLVNDDYASLCNAFPEVMTALGEDGRQIPYKNRSMGRGLVEAYRRWNQFSAWLGRTPEAEKTIQRLGRRYILSPLLRLSHSPSIQFEPEFAAQLTAQYARESPSILHSGSSIGE